MMKKNKSLSPRPVILLNCIVSMKNGMLHTGVSNESSYFFRF